VSRELIENYCRLVTSDAAACLELFHAEAVILTRIGSQTVEVSGRPKIEAFLKMTPRFLEYRLGNVKSEGGFLVAAIEIMGAHRGPESFRFFVDDGLIRRLEMAV
jgi:hypothetical protein